VFYVVTVKELARVIESYRNEMVNTLMSLIEVPAIGPDNGGEGELDKALRLQELIREWPFDKVERVDVPDQRAKGGVRPNILAYYYGEAGAESQRLWILTHLDVVPPGDLSQWTVTEPFKPLVKDGKVYGRGSEDNGQSMVASLYAVKALMSLGVRPKRTVVLAFVSDEETGSRYGLGWLVKERPDLFRKEDLVLVPDAGNSEGTFVEVAEKSILWFRVRVRGKQVHASMPHLGFNPNNVLPEYVSTLRKALHEKYSLRDDLYEPPTSTFEPTLWRSTSNAPNIIPSECEVVFDCRVLPNYSLDDVLSDAENIARELEGRYGKLVGEERLPVIKVEVIERLDAPPPTRPDSLIVKLLVMAVRELRGKEPKIGGIGGGTFAAYFRKLGIPAVVWSTIDETAHQPNEYSRIDNMVEDSKVMAALTILEER
jgi:succinyl-diaminopimelate desuccinylase